jgi:heme/copper-type cytochrome/quinol oxidase subunit 4
MGEAAINIEDALVGCSEKCVVFVEPVVGTCRLVQVFIHLNCFLRFNTGTGCSLRSTLDVFTTRYFLSGSFVFVI